MTRSILICLLTMFSVLLACAHVPEKEIVRSPQSLTSPASTEEAVAFVAKLVAGPQVDQDLYNFNKEAVTLCWRNPAWDELRFNVKNEARRKELAKIFLCNVPLQFRLCHTVKFLGIEKKFARGQMSLSERNAQQKAIFDQCDSDRKAYVRTAYKIEDASLNSLTNGQLYKAYQTVLLDRKTDLSPELTIALEQVRPSLLFKIDEDLLNAKTHPLTLDDALHLGFRGFQYGLDPQDIIDLIKALVGSKLPKFL